MIQVTNDLAELFLGLFMQVADCNSCSENGVVWVGDGHVGCRFCSLLSQTLAKSTVG